MTLVAAARPGGRRERGGFILQREMCRGGDTGRRIRVSKVHSEVN